MYDAISSANISVLNPTHFSVCEEPIDLQPANKTIFVSYYKSRFVCSISGSLARLLELYYVANLLVILYARCF